jgi:hypothetical protein
MGFCSSGKYRTLWPKRRHDHYYDNSIVLRARRGERGLDNPSTSSNYVIRVQSRNSPEFRICFAENLTNRSETGHL